MPRNDSNVPDNAISGKPKLLETHVAAPATDNFDDFVIIEICAKKKSAIHYAGLERKVMTMQVTKEEDLLHPGTREQLIHIIKKFTHVAIWATFPWSNNVSVQDKFTANRFIDVISELSRLTKDKGGSVHVELPIESNAWKLPSVNNLIKDLKLELIEVNPWAIATDNLHCANLFKDCEATIAERMKTDDKYTMRFARMIVDAAAIHAKANFALCSEMKRIDKTVEEHLFLGQESSRPERGNLQKNVSGENSDSENCMPCHEVSIDRSSLLCYRDCEQGPGEMNPIVVENVSESLPIPEASVSMSCIESGSLDIDSNEHRKKLGPIPSCFGMVVRQIKPSAPEFQSVGCKAALDKELSRLRAAGVWDEMNPISWKDAKRLGEEDGCGAMIGRLFCIMGEKHAELDRDICDKEYKARVVFGGHRTLPPRNCFKLCPAALTP